MPTGIFLRENAIKTHKEKMRMQLDKLWKYAQSVAASKLNATDPGGFNKINKKKQRKRL